MNSSDGSANEAPKNGRRNRDQNVMDAAIKIMSERGYPATPIQEIANQVGVLKGSLYHYFSSKEDLLFRILQEAHEEADRIMATAAALGLDPFDELLEFLRLESIWLLENQDRANVYWAESRHLTGEQRKEFAQHANNFRAYIDTLLEQAVAAGTVRSDISLETLSVFVIGSLNSVRSWPLSMASPINVEQIAQDASTLLQATLRPVPSHA